jgi:hypothetical protein
MENPNKNPGNPNKKSGKTKQKIKIIIFNKSEKSKQKVGEIQAKKQLISEIQTKIRETQT